MSAAKTIYHSALVKDSPVEITFTCDEPRESKFAGKPPYFTAQIDGQEVYIPVENDEIAEAMSGYNGQTVLVTATGSRNTASVTVDAEPDAAPQRKPAAAAKGHAAKPAARSGGGSMTPEEAFAKAKIYGAKCSVLMELSFRHAKHLLNKEMPDCSMEDIRAMAITLFIETKARVDIDGLPTKFIEKQAAAPAPVRKPDPRDADGDAADDDIQF